MPITTPQGTLDFKKVDRVTFVGASSNTVIDTTTGSLGVGVDGNGPTSKLHVVGNTRLEGDINMLHTSNTASIKLNSNVVAEFPRSKKLIKYPRVNLTQNALNNGYAAEASTENNGTSSGQAYRAFDGLANGERGYHSATVYTSGSTYNGTASITDADGTQHQGEWIKLQMPTTEKMKLSGFSFSPRYVSSAEYHHRTPYKGVFLGSTDGIGTNWYPIHYFDNVAGSELTTVSRTFENTTNDYYNHIALVVFEVGPNATYGDVLNLAEIELFGVPEYDPESHGTDVVVKSYPNVPNTDWLEVYYDAKGLENAPLSTASGAISGLGGTTNNGTAYGNPQISDGAFVLDGTGDYISTSVNATLTYHTASMWIMFDNPSTWEAVYFVGPSSVSGADNFAIYVHADNYFRLESGGPAGWPSTFFDVNYQFVPGKWVHMTVVFKGTGLEDCEVYIDNAKLSPAGVSSNPTTDHAITGTNNLNIGARPGYDLEGKIANFRLFNRVLTSDEIYQLYAYQKEDFGHSTNNMTLKAGRLGIGTSEPRAALDVRGDIYGGCPVFFTVYAYNGDGVANNPTGTSGGTIIQFNKTLVNKGGAYDTSNGRCTFPVSGYYEVFFRGGTSSTSQFHAQIFANGNAPGSGGWPDNVTRVYDNSGGQYRNAGTIQFFYYFTAGEYIEVRIFSGSFNEDNYNSFSVKYLSN